MKKNIISSVLLFIIIVSTTLFATESDNWNILDNSVVEVYTLGGIFINNFYYPGAADKLEEIFRTSDKTIGNGAFIIKYYDLNNKRKIRLIRYIPGQENLLPIIFQNDNTYVDTISPSAPDGLTKVTDTTNTLSISWNISSDNVAVIGYNIYVDSILIATVTTGNSYIITGLMADTSYFIYITAFDAAGNISPDSATINPTTALPPDNIAPATPTDLTASTTNDTTISIFWSPSGDNVATTGYKIYLDSIEIYDGETTNYIFSNLSPAVTYNITVKAYDAANNLSPASPTLSVTTTGVADITAPSIPSALTFISKTKTSITFSCTSATDNIAVVGYVVYADGTINTTNTTSTTFTAINLSVDTSYDLTLKSFDAAGNFSAVSTALTITTDSNALPTGSTKIALTSGMMSGDGNPAVLVDQQVLAGDPKEGTGGNLSTTPYWAPGTGDTAIIDLGLLYGNVEVYGFVEYGESPKDDIWVYSSPDNVTWTKEFTLQTTGQQWKNGTFANDTRYIKFFYTNGGSWSPSHLIELAIYGGSATPDIEAPTKVSNLQATALGSSIIRLTWSSATDDRGVDSYEIFQGASKIGETSLLIYNAINLTPSTLYNFTVKAKDVAGNLSIPSDSASATTTIADSTPPDQIIGLIAVNTLSTAVSLAWHEGNDNIMIAGYKIYINGSYFQTTTDTNYNIVGLTPETAYNFTIVAFDGDNNQSTPSAILPVTTAQDNTACQDSIPTYPSVPANGYIWVGAEKSSYAIGENVVFIIRSPGGGTVNYEIYEDPTASDPHVLLKSGTLSLGANEVYHFNSGVSLSHPGVIYLHADDGSMSISGGTGVDQCNIHSMATEPTDFDTYWTGLLDQLEAVPVNASRTLRNDRVDPTFGDDTRYDMYKITMDQIDGRKVYGWMTIPNSSYRLSNKMPVILELPAFGGGKMPYNTNLYVGCHPFMSPSPRAIYIQINIHYVDIETTDGDYQPNDTTDHTKFYLKWCIMASMRAIDYIYEDLPEFDGTNLIVTGKSQGGGLSFFVAGLDRENRIRDIATVVPAHGEHVAFLSNMGAGFPSYGYHEIYSKLHTLTEAEAVINEAEYYDITHFAKRWFGPTFCMVGYRDTIVPAYSVLAAFNNLPGTNLEFVHGMDQTHDYFGNWMGQRAAYLDKAMDRLGVPTP